jgi:methyl-accepting chemotaxis protein
MKQQPPRSSALRFLFPAICVLLAVSASIIIAGASSARALGAVALGLGLVGAAFAWLVFTRDYLRPARDLFALQDLVKDGLEGLVSSLAALSTGNLTAKVSPSHGGSNAAAPSFAPSARGEFLRLAELSSGTAELLREGIESFNGITDEPCLRLCYVGSDSYAEGQAVGEFLGTLLRGSSSIAVITGDLHSANHSLRRKGALNALASKNPQIESVGTVETFESQERSYAAAQELLRRHRELGAIYVTEGTTPPAVAKAVEESGRAGKTWVVAHDLTDATMEYVAKGVIAATVSQDPFAQGHDPAIRLFNHLVAGWKPTAPRLLTSLQVVTRDNYRQYWSAGSASGAGDRGRLAKVLPAASAKGETGRKRIAVVCMQSDAFWSPVYAGAMDAKRELEGYGASVEWFVPPPNREGSLGSASNYAPIVKRLVAERWEALAIPIFDRELVPLLNEAARAGMAVVTYNAEPPSLREMLSSVSDQTSALLDLSQELAASAEESGQSTVSIAATMDRITGSLRSQAEESVRTQEEILTLAGNIRRVNETASASSRTARLVAEASAKGSAAVGRMRESVRMLEDASSVSETTIRTLKEDSDRIGKIVEAIEEIANQTNVLAINASIQAARAGERGKGFAVIAAEVRKLAEQSNQSALEIKRLIGELRGRVKAAEDATSRGLAEAKANAENAELSMASLREISELAGENERSMEVIFGSVEEMLSFSRRIEETARSLAQMNERSDAAASEIGASTKEVSAQAADVAGSARSISEMAKAQRALLSQFRLSEED